MTGRRGVLAAQAVAFALVSLMHRGILLRGYAHREAATAETVIAVVLLVGLVTGLLAPRSARMSAMVAQGFALLGTAVGIVMIAIGVGPRTVLDVLIHATFVAMLVTGLYRTWHTDRPRRMT